MGRKILADRKILKVLHDFQQEVAEKYALRAIGVFGSAARGENHEGSDVDVVLRIDKPDLFMLADIKQELEARLHCPVDIVSYRDNMNHFLKQKIDQEAVYA